MTATLDAPNLAPHNGHTVSTPASPDNAADTGSGTGDHNSEQVFHKTAYLLDGEHTRETVEYIDACHDADVMPTLWGEPGVGKTSLITALAQRQGFGGMHILLLHSMERCDTLGAMRTSTYTDHTGKTWESTTYATPAWAIRANDYQGTFYLFCDEIDKCDPDVQAAFLTIIQDRIMPSGFPLGDHVKFIGAGNPPAKDSGYEIIAPLQNRMMEIKYAPPIREWFKGMNDAWGRVGVSADEKYLRGLIVAYLTNNGANLHQPPKDGDTAQAWASRRSWDNLARVGSRFVRNPDRMKGVAIGLLGEAVGRDFVAKTTAIPLPDPSKIAADPSKVDWTDALTGFMALSSVLSWAQTTDEMLKVAGVFNYAATHGPRDVTASKLQEFMIKCKDKAIGAKPVLALDKNEFAEYMAALYDRKGQTAQRGSGRRR